MDTMEAKPLLKKLSYPNGEATMHKKMVVGFPGLFAKRANPTIIPTLPPQSVCRPWPILQGKLRVILDFWRSPHPPNNVGHTRFNKSKELQFVSGRHGVLPIARELSSDIILNILDKMHSLNKGPKENKL
jgi:hypothetical protein